MAVQIQWRRDTAANWTAANPTLAQGEAGYETDTGKLKMGDGATAWNALAYVTAWGGGGGGGAALSAGTQSVNTGTVVFSNSNNITFGMAGSSRITGSYNFNASAGTTSNNLNSLKFADSNGISFGLNASTITASHNGLTSQSNQAFSAGAASSAFQTLSFQDSNGLSFSNNAGAIRMTHDLQYTSNTSNITSNALHTSASRVINIVAATNNTGGGTASLSSNVSFSNANGLTFYTSAGNAVVGSYTVPTQTAQTLGLYASSQTTAQSSSSTVDARSLSIVGMGVASVGLSAGSFVISVPSGGGAGDGYNILAAGTQTATTAGTVKFADSNGISFGMSNSTQITASYTVPSTAGLISAIKVSAGTTSNNLSALTFADSNGISFGLNASTVTASHNGLTSQSNQAFSAGAASSAFQTLSFQDSNGISFSNNAGAIRLTHDLQFTSNTSAITSNALHTSASRVMNIIAATNNTGGGTASLSSNVSFSAANGLTFYTSAGNAIVGSHNALTTARASTDAIGLNTAQTNVTWTANSSGLSINAAGYAGTTTAITGNAAITLNSLGLRFDGGGLAGTGTTFAGANVSGSMTLNSVGLNLSLSAGAGGGVTPVASASNGSFSFTTLNFSNANNVTFGTSAGSIITASVAAPGAAAENNWVNLLGANTAGNTTASGSTIGMSGVNLTLSGTNGSQIVLSAPATSSIVGASGISLSTNGSTVSVMPQGASYFGWPINVMYTTQTQTVASNTSVVFPIELHDKEELAYIMLPGTVSIASMASISTAANNTKSYTQAATFNFVLYSRGIGASSMSLQSVASTSHSSQMTIAIGQNANGSQWTVSHAFSFPDTGTAQTTTSSNYATTLSNVNVSTTHLTFISGAKKLGFPWATTLSQGQYWLATGIQTAATTNGNASLSNMRVTQSMLGMPQSNLTWGEFGSANNASIMANYGIGSYTKAATGTTDSIGLANISSSASHVMPYITFARIA